MTTQPMMAPAHVRVDPMRQLLLDLHRDRERLRQMRDPTPQKLALEMNDTVMQYMQDIAAHNIGLRDEIGKLHGWLQEVVPDLDARLDALEADEPVGLDDETLLLLVEIVGRCRGFVEAALTQSPNIDKAAKTELEELRQKCDVAIERLDDIGTEDDEDDEEGDDEDAEPRDNGSAAEVPS